MEAAEKGELTELVLLVIWNRLDLARRDVSYLIFVSVSEMICMVAGAAGNYKNFPSMPKINSVLYLYYSFKIFKHEIMRLGHCFSSFVCKIELCMCMCFYKMLMSLTICLVLILEPDYLCEIVISEYITVEDIVERLGQFVYPKTLFQINIQQTV